MKRFNLMLAVTTLVIVLSSCSYCPLILRTGLRPDKPVVTVGETLTLTPYDESCGASGEIPPLLWTSDKPEVASVDRTTGKVTGVAEGTAFILALPVAENDIFSGNVLITVTSP